MVYIIYKVEGERQLIKEFGSTANEFFTPAYLDALVTNYGGSTTDYLIYILPETSEDETKIKNKENINGFKLDKELKLYALVV